MLLKAWRLMLVRKLFKKLDPGTIFRVIDSKGELIATGVVEDFSEDPDYTFVKRKVKSITLLKNEKFKDLEGTDYLYLEIYVK